MLVLKCPEAEAWHPDFDTLSGVMTAVLELTSTLVPVLSHGVIMVVWPSPSTPEQEMG